MEQEHVVKMAEKKELSKLGLLILLLTTLGISVNQYFGSDAYYCQDNDLISPCRNGLSDDMFLCYYDIDNKESSIYCPTKWILYEEDKKEEIKAKSIKKESNEYICNQNGCKPNK